MYSLGWDNGQVTLEGAPVGVSFYNLLYNGMIVGGVANEALGAEIVRLLNFEEVKKRAAKAQERHMAARESWFVYDQADGLGLCTQVPRTAIPKLEELGAIYPMPNKPRGYYVRAFGYTLTEIERLAS